MHDPVHKLGESMRITFIKAKRRILTVVLCWLGAGADLKTLGLTELGLRAVTGHSVTRTN